MNQDYSPLTLVFIAALILLVAVLGAPWLFQ